VTEDPGSPGGMAPSRTQDYSLDPSRKFQVDSGLDTVSKDFYDPITQELLTEKEYWSRIASNMYQRIIRGTS